MLIFEENVGFIWDIDGVVVDSPHEEAWRATAHKVPWGIKEFTSEFYLNNVASRPRREGGNVILTKHGVYDKLGAKTEKEKKEMLEEFCAQKNKMVRDLIEKGGFATFASSAGLIIEAKLKGIKQAAASASKNAVDMLKQIILKDIPVYNDLQCKSLQGKRTLYSLFDIDVCGLDLDEKKDIIAFAAKRLKQISRNEISDCVVFEDAPAGIKAADSLGMFSVGIARIGSKEYLRQAGANVVVSDLEEITYENLKLHFLKKG